MLLISKALTWGLQSCSVLLASVGIGKLLQASRHPVLIVLFNALQSQKQGSSVLPSLPRCDNVVLLTAFSRQYLHRSLSILFCLSYFGRMVSVLPKLRAILAGSLPWPSTMLSVDPNSEAAMAKHHAVFVSVAQQMLGCLQIAANLN